MGNEYRDRIRRGFRPEEIDGLGAGGAMTEADTTRIYLDLENLRQVEKRLGLRAARPDSRPPTTRRIYQTEGAEAQG